MSLKSNPYIKVGVILLCAVLFFVVLLPSGQDDPDYRAESPTRGGSSEPGRTSAEDILALGAALEDVSRSSQAHEQRAAQTELQLRELQESLNAIAASNESGRSTDEIMDEVRSLIEAQLELSLMQGSMSPSDAPDVNEIVIPTTRPSQNTQRQTSRQSSSSPFEETFNIGESSSRGSSSSSKGELNWVFPVGYEAGNESVLETIQAANPFGSSSFSPAPRGGATSEGEPLPPEPYVTIPPDSWMFDATALTALVGRIERDGTNHAPWDFDVILSGDVSIANNHNLPEIQDARVSGVAIGDQAARCIRGYVTSITFVFTDGRVYNKTASMQEPIAMIGDEYGNPCVPGDYYSNTKELIAAHGTVSGIQAVARSIEQRQQTIETSATSQSLSLTGNAGRAAAGAFGAGSADKLGDIIAQQYEAYYPFVYAPPGQKLSLRFRQFVNIDYSHQQRKVRYENDFGYSWP